jgi:signal transduction histidine kinase
MRRRGPEGEELEDEVEYQSSSLRRRSISVLEEEGESGDLVAPRMKRPVRREARYRRLAAGTGERILVVDDSPVSVEILRELLVGHGYEVVLAPDGPTAVDRLSREPPDLVITELWLPRMSGFELVKAARQREESALTPIILLTSRRDREDIAYGLNLGADDYLSKPFDRAELLARIGVLLRLKRAREELVRLNLGLEAEVKKRTAELATTQARLYLSEKLKSLGQLTAGIAHEMNNPLSFAFSNVEIVKERLLARDALRGIRRIRPLTRAAAGEGTRVTLEEKFLSELAENTLFRQDVADYREEAEDLTGRVRAGRFLEFLAYVEHSATRRGGDRADLFEHAVRLLSAAEEGMQRVREIVRDLSAFSHPGSEETAAVDLSRSVNRVLTILSPAVREKSIRVTKSLRLGLPVRAVTGRVDQVLMNLLQNAVQASPENGTIRIRTRRDGAFGRLEVEDFGSGIPDEVKSQIFDPFFTTKPVGEGTGLGLAICYRIVEGFNGEISFKSRKGRGTTFVVRLPIAVEDAQ